MWSVWYNFQVNDIYSQEYEFINAIHTEWIRTFSSLSLHHFQFQFAAGFLDVRLATILAIIHVIYIYFNNFPNLFFFVMKSISPRIQWNGGNVNPGKGLVLSRTSFTQINFENF